MNFKPFSEILGNEHVKRYLFRMATKNAIANSLLFAGPEGIGKSLFALDFAKMVMCKNEEECKRFDNHNHPDLHLYHPEGKIGMHSIGSMRKFSQEVYMPPYEAEWKVFIVYNAERMLPYGANALLKTFEEPDPRSIIILLSSSPESLLPTILSRCLTVRFNSLSKAEIKNYLINRSGKEEKEAEEIASLSEGSIGKAISLTKEEGNGLRDSLLNLLSQGKFENYTHLIKTSHELAGQIEASKKQEEELVRQTVLKGSGKDLSAAQKHELEKEIEGAVLLYGSVHAHGLFNAILSWYRDIHLIHVNGDLNLIINKKYMNSITQAYQKGFLLPLEKVQKAVSEAELSLERSTPLNICLEKLFLQLNLL